MDTNESREPKWKTPFMIALGTITAIAILAGIVINCTSHFSFGFNNKVVTGTIEINEKIESIDLDIDLGDISVEYGDQAKLSYECPEKLIPKVSEKNGCLTITSPKKVNLKGFNNIKDYNFSYVLVIPKNTELKIVNMDLDCGNIKFSGLKADEYVINADLGNVELDDMDCKRFEVDADMGNVEIADSTFGTIKVNADMGNIEFKKVQFENGEFDADMGSIFVSGDYPEITAKCSMGAIDVETDRDEKDVRFNLDADMGSITINGKSR